MPAGKANPSLQYKGQAPLQADITALPTSIEENQELAFLLFPEPSRKEKPSHCTCKLFEKFDTIFPLSSRFTNLTGAVSFDFASEFLKTSKPGVK